MIKLLNDLYVDIVLIVYFLLKNVDFMRTLVIKVTSYHLLLVEKCGFYENIGNKGHFISLQHLHQSLFTWILLFVDDGKSANC